ncbi:MAG: N-acetyltransferase [Planctomycetota bacterium]
MSSIEVQHVTTAAQRKQFLGLPWKINVGDPNWMPPLRGTQKQLCGFGSHPFYEDAEALPLLAVRGGEPVGRLLAIVNHAHNRWSKEKRGFFGFFESVDDQAVSEALFDRGFDWLRDQGMTAVRGPANPSLNYEWGLLIKGFDKPPMFMMTHNQPYYAKLVEAAGFEKAQDLYAFWGEVDMLKTMKNDKKMLNLDANIRERFGVTLRTMNRKRFRAEVEMFLDIYNQALAGTWGYIPLSKSEINHMAGELRYLIEPEVAIVAEHEGKPIGVMFGLLDYNPRIKKIDGRLFPFGFLTLLRNKRAIKRLRLVSTNVLPAYQGWGVGVVLGIGMLQPALSFGLREVEFSWVLESNDLSRKTLEKGGAERYKEYRIYDREL